jgi:hypothetical protein
MRKPKRRNAIFHRATYWKVRECLHQTNHIYRRELERHLQMQNGTVARIREFLFHHPSFMFNLTILLLLFCILGGIYIRVFFNHALLLRTVYLMISLILILLCCTCAILISLITHRVKADWDERWFDVANRYLLNDPHLEIGEVLFNLRGAASYYEQQGEMFKWINKGALMIFLACFLPEPNFRDAFFSMSVQGMILTDCFGFINLMILSTSSVHYFSKYHIPVVRIKSVIAQIDG